MDALFHEISALPSEQINPRTIDIDTASVEEILTLISSEDARVVPAVREQLAHIATLVEHVARAFGFGGRLFYIGAGTSGRLGVVDASECPPTFGTPAHMVQGIIAGGLGAMFQAVEGAEDSFELGIEELKKVGLTKTDVVCGIAASGRTPFVRGALHYARECGAYSAIVSTNNEQGLRRLGIDVDCYICPATGPEVIAGSTRMKAGTAQKLVLNMVTTAAMIRIGKTFGNVMVDLQLTNKKLVSRATRVLMTTTGMSKAEAEDFLERANGHVKTAMVMYLAGCTAEQARLRLDAAGGFVRQALGDSNLHIRLPEQSS